MFVDYHLNTLLGIDYKYAYEMNCNFEQFMFDDDYEDYYNILNGRHAMMMNNCYDLRINNWRKKYV